jgi:hypothetical protein
MAVTKDLADSTTLMVIARLAMIAATAALPAVGWLLIRSVSTVDDIGHKVDSVHDQVLETGGTVKVIQQTQTVQGQILTDHEARMRALERNALDKLQK